MANYGLALKKLREHFSFTQRELGERVGISNHAISKWENGVNEPDLATVQSICAVYGISTEDFFRIANGETLESVLLSKEIPVEIAETTGAGTRSSKKIPLIISLLGAVLCLLTAAAFAFLRPSNDSPSGESIASSESNTESQDGEQSASSENIGSTSSVYHLSYYVDGECAGTTDVFNGVLPSPYIPEKTGYVFLGWYTRQTGGELFNFNNVTASASIHAQFRPIQYTLVFQTGYNKETEIVSVEFAEDWTFPTALFSRSGYVQTGWATDDSVTYALGAKGGNLTTTDGATVFLTAVWAWLSPDSVCVKFISEDGDTVGSMPDQLATIDTPFALPKCRYQRAGYTFDGWECQGVTYAAGEEITLTADDATQNEYTIVARWKGITWHINYWLRDNGQIYEAAMDYTYGEEAYLADGEWFSARFPDYDFILGWIINGTFYAAGENIDNFTLVDGEEFWAEAVYETY